MALELTPYFDEFVRYYRMAEWQQKNCNLNDTLHLDSPFDDDLMKNVFLYDVINRKYAGFTQILLDLWFGDTKDHPYHKRMHDIRKPIAASSNGLMWSLHDWLYIFILHRVTGSAINYAKSPSGYWNTILPYISSRDAACGTIQKMTEKVKTHDKTFYTSVGYQFPAFPKPTTEFKRGGDYYLVEFAPRLAVDLADFLTRQSEVPSFRKVGEWMFSWNKLNGLRAYKFQYAAVLADIADFYPELIDANSMFYYGTNAVESLSYMAVKPKKMNQQEFLDEVMDEFTRKTGARPYDAEDVACDCIRWIENYVRPGHSYSQLDRDKVFSSHKILDHPFGRQRKHLELGLIKSFNDISVHPSDDYIIKTAGLSVEQYKTLVKESV